MPFWLGTEGGAAMPIDKRAANAAEALAGVSDGATVFISGFGGAGFPNFLIRALARSRPEETSPWS